MMMMLDDSGDSAVEGDSAGRGSRGGAVGSSLSVNKVSSKIGKGIRRPAPQPLTVYKTGPEGFRNLVQELTGASSHEVVSSSNNARPPLAATTSRTPPNNGRLQNLAPPPLMAPPPASLSSSKPSFESPQRFPPLLSPLSLSPLAAAAPAGDNVWACSGLESPASASMRHLAQLVAAGGASSAEMVVQQQHSSSPLCLSPTFPLSPSSFPPSFTSSSNRAGYSLATVVAASSNSARDRPPPPPDFSFPGGGS